jgi:hypothetical protein
MQFFLGTHMPSWLAEPRFADVPLFVSRRTLAQRKNLPRAAGSWALDSGGFTELQMHGEWKLTAREYAAEVRRFRDEIGRMEWAAPQDWMCEPIVLAGGRASGGIVFAGTKLSVEEHQRRTVENFLELRSIAPDLPIIPVLQGWTLFDYWRCEEAYARAGVDLRAEPRVGVGTVCRRQGTAEATRIMSSLAVGGLKLHGFGFKTQGLQACHLAMDSADSLAWSFAARRDPPLPGHDLPGGIRRFGHINCANCPDYALAWRAQLLASIGQGGPGGGPRPQLELWEGAAA